jgi:acetylornithine deacetylase
MRTWTTFDNPQETVVDDDRIYGRGLVNMKAAFPCYIEAVAAIQKAGVKLKGDLIIAGVVGEIERRRSAVFRQRPTVAPASARVT